MIRITIKKSRTNFCASTQIGDFQDTVVIAKAGSASHNRGRIQADFYFNAQAFEEGGAYPICSEFYEYDTTDTSFLNLLTTNNGDTQATAEAYLLSLPEFAGGVAI